MPGTQPQSHPHARPGFRLLPFAAAPPAWNMAVDEAILRLADRPTLRFYGWDPPAVSLGRFQDFASVPESLSAAGLPFVRRMTGGGAIVHWHELTYSLFLPADHPLLAGCTARESYARLHAPIREALAGLGIDTESRGRPGEDPEAGASASRSGPFLCFARATSLDLVAGGRKLVGSAQRRTAGRMLQHGSIILRENPLQPGTASLDVLSRRPVSAPDLADLVVESFSRRLGRFQPGELSESERALANRLVADVAVHRG